MIDVSVDTTLVVDLLRRHRRAQNLLGQFDHPAASHVVFGELLLGGMKSSQPAELTKIFKAFEGITILEGTATTSEIYARLRWRLEIKGTPIPHNDLWIAAASIEAGVPLITRDQHFKLISELTILDY